MSESDDDKGKPQPWHAADEKPAGRKRGGAPIGTHSFTGGGATVGMPPQGEDAERGIPQGQPQAAEPDPLAEPRANAGEPLGPKR